MNKKKTMFKVSNRNTRKICLLMISKITLKASERRHPTTTYLAEVTVQNHVWTVFLRIYTNLQSKVLLSSLTARNFNNRNLFMSFYEKSLTKYLVNENSKFEHFFISEKTAPKTDIFFNFLPYI